MPPIYFFFIYGGDHHKLQEFNQIILGIFYKIHILFLRPILRRFIRSSKNLLLQMTPLNTKKCGTGWVTGRKPRINNYKSNPVIYKFREISGIPSAMLAAGLENMVRHVGLCLHSCTAWMLKCKTDCLSYTAQVGWNFKNDSVRNIPCKKCWLNMLPAKFCELNSKISLLPILFYVLLLHFFVLCDIFYHVFLALYFSLSFILLFFLPFLHFPSCFFFVSFLISLVVVSFFSLISFFISSERR